METRRIQRCCLQKSFLAHGFFFVVVKRRVFCIKCPGSSGLRMKAAFYVLIFVFLFGCCLGAGIDGDGDADEEKNKKAQELDEEIRKTRAEMRRRYLSSENHFRASKTRGADVINEEEERRKIAESDEEKKKMKEANISKALKRARQLQEIKDLSYAKQLQEQEDGGSRRDGVPPPIAQYTDNLLGVNPGSNDGFYANLLTGYNQNPNGMSYEEMENALRQEHIDAQIRLGMEYEGDFD
ncbi:MAG: uncharacterized protein A8A55_0123 [Amphiamblys sp. WSBS2006]|nr:MAG: uncharacterized protein A8A55_0123 [Amphiamblys sp. WSBS2006]